jgi:hypothetical protein
VLLSPAQNVADVNALIVVRQLGVESILAINAVCSDETTGVLRLLHSIESPSTMPVRYASPRLFTAMACGITLPVLLYVLARFA